MGSAGGFLVGIMMFLTVAEVLSRIFLKASIEGIIELQCVFFALVVFFGFSPCEEKDAHVKVNLVTIHLPMKFSLPLDIVVYLLAILIVSVSGWQLGLDAATSWEIREALPGAMVQVPVYPAKIAAFVGYLAFCLQLVLHILFRVLLPFLQALLRLYLFFCRHFP